MAAASASHAPAGAQWETFPHSAFPEMPEQRFLDVISASEFLQTVSHGVGVGRGAADLIVSSSPITKIPQVPAATILWFLKGENYRLYTSYFSMWELLEQIKGSCVRTETESYCRRGASVGGTGISTTIILL